MPSFGMVRDMASLRDQFAPYYRPDQEAVAAALRTGLVTPDTNVLLAAYRFERQAREELFSAFEKLGNRLWIPHQVAFEFHRNRLAAMAAQETFFGKAQDDLETAMGTYLTRLRAFTGRIAMPQARVQQLEKAIRDAHARVTAQVTAAEEANEVHLDSHNSDGVLTRLEAIFGDGRVGEPMTPEELEAARKEAKRRVEQKVPPGYADKDKADPTGDYLLWKQLLQEASARKLPVILVTDDRKEDWVRRTEGKTLGPRPELYEEMTAAAGAPFHLMTTATFLRHAKAYLSVTVSPETVEQARELPAVLAERQRASLEEEQLAEEIVQLEAQLQVLRMQADRADEEFSHLMLRLGATEATHGASASSAEGEIRELHDRLAESRARKDWYQQEQEKIAHALAQLRRNRERAPDGEIRRAKTADLSKLLVSDLQRVAQELGIQETGRMRKGDLVQAIQERIVRRNP